MNKTIKGQTVWANFLQRSGGTGGSESTEIYQPVCSDLKALKLEILRVHEPLCLNTE